MVTDSEKLSQLCVDVAVIKSVVAPEGQPERGQFVTKMACAVIHGATYKRIVWLFVGALVVAVVTAWTSTHLNGKATAAAIARLRAEVVKVNGSR